jgi:hypothetical protein
MEETVVEIIPKQALSFLAPNTLEHSLSGNARFASYPTEYYRLFHRLIHTKKHTD